MGDPVFVFGSNLAGRHGKGAALWAKQHRGAIYGQGEGYQGSSYAIPTKDERINTLPLFRIRNYVHLFKRFAREHPELTFHLTPIGCGLAGYTPEQIAPLFDDVPANVILPEEFSMALLAKEVKE
nr:MAG TPA: NON-STRUCTURAL PROTEIN 3 PROTEIN, STRUCTURAL GENOMICS, MARSEILLES [Caudoviricetes sp.]